MHQTLTPNFYEHSLARKRIKNNRQCYSEQIFRNRAKVSSPSSHSLNSSVEVNSPLLLRVNYTPKKLFALAQPAPNRRASASSSSSLDRTSSSDKSTSFEDDSPSRTSIFDRYLRSYETPRRNGRNSYCSPHVATNSALSTKAETPARARAGSVDCPSSIKQLMSAHISPCSCSLNSGSTRQSPAVSKSMSYSSPSLDHYSSPSSATKNWPQATRAITSPLNIYLRTRKRQNLPHQCQSCK